MIKNFIICVLLLVVSFPLNATNILAKSWLIADGDGNILEQENIDIKQPIASITKLMTAMVVLDANEDMTSEIAGHRLRGLTVSRIQLLKKLSL